MISRVNVWRAVSVAAVAALGSALVLIVGSAATEPTGAGHGHHTTDGLDAELRAQVFAEGLEAALGRLRAMAADDDAVLLSAHHHVHEVGYAGQARYGTAEAFARCDGSFDGGCYHAVVQAHFAGVAAVDRSVLATFCSGGVIAAGDLEAQCLHGVGHGLAGLFADDLNTALEHCAVVGGDDAPGQCHDGVFMQAAHRSPPPTGLCAGLGRQYLASCHFHRAEAVFRGNGHDLAATFAACDRAGPPYAVYCYEGAGRLAGLVADLDPDRSQAHCRQAAQPYQPACVRGAARLLVTKFGPGAQTARLCALAPVGTRTGCMELVAHPPSGPPDAHP